jgi:hypothetical protein
MKRIKAYLIITLGITGFCIAPSDSLLQAVIGVSMLWVSVWLTRRNWRAVYREIVRIGRFEEKIFGADEPEEREKGRI